MDMPIEMIPTVIMMIEAGNGIMAQHNPLSVRDGDFLIICNFHEERLKFPVLQKLLVMIPHNQVLIAVQRFHDFYGSGGIIPADIPQQKNIVLHSHRLIPVFNQRIIMFFYCLKGPVVKCQRILMPEMRIRYKIECHLCLPSEPGLSRGCHIRQTYTTSIWHILMVSSAASWVFGVTPAQQDASTPISISGQ